MPARTGQQYLDRLRQSPPNLWILGKRIEDPTSHPLTRSIVHSIASLYDLQHDPHFRDEMTYISPSSGERIGLSFLETHSRGFGTSRPNAYPLGKPLLGIYGPYP